MALGVKRYHANYAVLICKLISLVDFKDKVLEGGTWVKLICLPFTTKTMEKYCSHNS
jgi:hypothetical protein